MNKNTVYMLSRLEDRGISLDDAIALRRISMTLHRWHDLECGDDRGCIERDEAAGKKPYWLNYRSMRRSPIADREAGALRRLAAIMARYPELRAYVQGDPRGAALYIYRADDLKPGNKIDAHYSSIGTAVYK